MPTTRSQHKKNQEMAEWWPFGMPNTDSSNIPIYQTYNPPTYSFIPPFGTNDPFHFLPQAPTPPPPPQNVPTISQDDLDVLSFMQDADNMDLLDKVLRSDPKRYLDHLLKLGAQLPPITTSSQPSTSTVVPTTSNTQASTSHTQPTISQTSTPNISTTSTTSTATTPTISTAMPNISQPVITSTTTTTVNPSTSNTMGIQGNITQASTSTSVPPPNPHTLAYLRQLFSQQSHNTSNQSNVHIPNVNPTGQHNPNAPTYSPTTLCAPTIPQHI